MAAAIVLAALSLVPWLILARVWHMRRNYFKPPF